MPRKEDQVSASIVVQIVDADELVDVTVFARHALLVKTMVILVSMSQMPTRLP